MPLSSGRGVAGEERNAEPRPFWCLGILASVPHHQGPEGTNKLTPASVKRRPKGWGPSTAVASLAAPRQEEAQGTKRALREPSLSVLRATVRGREAASAEASQPGRGWNFTASGATGLLKDPDSGFWLLASDSVGAATAAAFRTEGGDPGPWEWQAFWFPNVPGVPATPRLQRGDPHPTRPFGYICDLLSSFRFQENNYGDTRHCHEMLLLTPSFYSWRFKQDPDKWAHGSPAPKQLLWLRGAWAGSLGSRRTFRLGARLARGKRPGGEDSLGWILKAN